jgi:hypothetical protein
MLSYGNHCVGKTNNYCVSGVNSDLCLLTLGKSYYWTAFGSGYDNGNDLTPPPDAIYPQMIDEDRLYFELPNAYASANKIVGSGNDQVKINAIVKPYWRLSYLGITNDGTNYTAINNGDYITLSSNLTARVLCCLNTGVWTASGFINSARTVCTTAATTWTSFVNAMPRRMHFRCTHSSDNMPKEFITSAIDYYKAPSGSTQTKTVSSMIFDAFTPSSACPNMSCNYQITGTYNMAGGYGSSAEFRAILGYETCPLYGQGTTVLGGGGGTSNFSVSASGQNITNIAGGQNFFLVSGSIRAGEMFNDVGWWSASGIAP